MKKGCTGGKGYTQQGAARRAYELRKGTGDYYRPYYHRPCRSWHVRKAGKEERRIKL